jgi:hypothetical protein
MSGSAARRGRCLPAHVCAREHALPRGGRGQRLAATGHEREGGSAPTSTSVTPLQALAQHSGRGMAGLFPRPDMPGGVLSWNDLSASTLVTPASSTLSRALRGHVLSSFHARRDRALRCPLKRRGMLHSHCPHAARGKRRALPIPCDSLSRLVKFPYTCLPAFIVSCCQANVDCRRKIAHVPIGDARTLRARPHRRRRTSPARPSRAVRAVLVAEHILRCLRPGALGCGY